jgi:pyruvate formate lyase activating enzyme
MINGERGYCGLRWNLDGLKTLSNSREGVAYSYLDPHPTNCCAAWFCPATTGTGYPRYAHRNGPEYGYNNLAVFLYGCNFNCLFCQNSSHKKFKSITQQPPMNIASQLSRDSSISCICFFGSPEPQLPFALMVAELALERRKDNILRICWEWNGCGDPIQVRKAAEISLETGGNIKFDLKAYSKGLSLTLSGVSNKRAYDNFEMIAKDLYPKRSESPLLTATTLMVPGYIDGQEIEKIAMFIENLDPYIPYSLLAFHPNYYMTDLPYTPLEQAVECYIAAKNHLKKVNIGNLHILGIRTMEQFESITESFKH